MIPDVIVQFMAHGVGDVVKATATVAEQLARFEQRQTSAARRGKEDRTRAVKDEAREKEKLLKQSAKEAERAEREKTRIVRNSSTMAGRYAAELAREEKRAEDAKTKAVERAEREKDRIRRRSSEMAGRYAAKLAAEEQRLTERSSRTKSRVLSGAFRGGGTLGRLAGGAASLAGATLGIGGGLFLAGAAREQLSADKAAAQLINSATVGGVRPGVSARQLTSGAGQISAELGIDKTELIAGMQNYVAKSSDVKGGLDTGPQSLARFFAKVSTATGTSLEDVTGMAGILRAQNKDLGPGEMKQMILDVIEQGKAGAVEIQDLANLSGGAGATRGMYAGNATENQRKLLALSQITRTESESPEEAVTGVKDLAIEALKKSQGKHAPAWLKKVITKQGTIESPEALIEASLRGTGGNLGQLEGIYGARGVKTFMRLAPIFNKAGGGDAGMAAVRAEMAPIMGAKGSEPRLDAMLKEVMDTPTQKFAVALDKVKNNLEERMEPALEKFADKLSDPATQKSIDGFIDGVASVAKFMADNPYAGIGAVVLAAVTKDIASAAIGQVVAATIAKMMGSTAVGSVVGGVPGASMLPALPGIVLAASIRSVGTDETEKALNSGEQAKLLARKSALEKEISHPTLDGQQRSATGETVARGIRSVLSPAAGALGFDTFEKQLQSVNLALKALEEQAKKTTPAIAANRAVRSDAPATSIGQRSAM